MNRTPLAALLLAVAGCASEVRIEEAKILDLTYPFNEKTVYWPTEKGFELEREHYGFREPGGWYAANRFCAAEHGGTHLDAPIHFAEDRWTTAEVPVERLIGPARVIDIREECAADRDYRLQPDDILRHEERYGRIAPGSVVLVLTGFGKFYPDPEKYLGNDRGDVSDLHFPGIGAAAAAFLAELRVDCVGIDTASIDHGPSEEFPSHRILCRANIPALENVARLDEVPPGALIVALPMKIDGGTGGPCRIIAILP